MPKTILVILALYNLSNLIGQISDHVKVLRATIGLIIYWAIQTLDHPLYSNKRVGRPAKLDGRIWRALICHIEQNLDDNLASLITYSKFGIKLSLNAV